MVLQVVSAAAEEGVLVIVEAAEYCGLSSCN